MCSAKYWSSRTVGKKECPSLPVDPMAAALSRNRRKIMGSEVRHEMGEESYLHKKHYNHKS